jgi:putative transcriptional regulator
MATTMKRNRRNENVYHYVESGLNNVYLDGGVHFENSPYGKAVSIDNVDKLHACIAKCLVEKPGGLIGPEFRFLRTELDYSQRMMAQLCGREERSIREWEAKVDEEIPEPANTIIRFIYKQRREPTAQFEKVSLMLAALHEADRDYFEMRLTPTKDGWAPQAKAKAA